MFACFKRTLKHKMGYQKRKEEHLRRLSSPSVWMASACWQWPPFVCAAPGRSVRRNRYVSKTRRAQWASRTPASALALSMRINNIKWFTPNHWLFGDGTHGKPKCTVQYSIYRRRSVRSRSWGRECSHRTRFWRRRGLGVGLALFRLFPECACALHRLAGGGLEFVWENRSRRRCRWSGCWFRFLGGRLGSFDETSPSFLWPLTGVLLLWRGGGGSCRRVGILFLTTQIADYTYIVYLHIKNMKTLRYIRVTKLTSASVQYWKKVAQRTWIGLLIRAVLKRQSRREARAAEELLVAAAES